MKLDTPIAVCSRSFSKNQYLRDILERKYSDIKFNDEGVSLNNDSLVEFLKGKKKAITALEKIDNDILKQLPELEVIGKYGVGLDMLDFQALEDNNVKLGWKPGVNKSSVAELVVSFSINLLRGINFVGHELDEEVWKQYKGRQLSSITFGIIGLGNVGKELVRYLQPFGPKIIFTDIREYPEFEKSNNIQRVELNELLSNSDIVSIHIPKNESTSNFISKNELALMKESSCIINTSRGGIVNEEDLLQAILNGKLHGAALDVFENEPCLDKKLVENPKIIMTPHIGGSSLTAIENMGLAAIDGLENFNNALFYKQYK